MGDRILRQAFAALIKLLVQRRGMTSTEGQNILDILNRGEEVEPAQPATTAQEPQAPAQSESEDEQPTQP